MKKIFSLILTAFIIISAAAFSGCDNKSQNAKLGLQAMDEGDYDRAKRLYNFAIEHGEADSEDRQIFDILTAYTDANRALKSEDFAQGLEILENCRYDYSSLSINEDMDKLYNNLSNGKYADERIKALTGVVNAGDYTRARTMYEEISALTLTSLQQDKLYELSRTITNETKEDEAAVYYKVNRSEDEDVPMYYEADSASDEICRIEGGTQVEVISFAEGGFIEIYYDGHTGYMNAAALVPVSVPSKGNKDKEEKNEQTNNGDKNEEEKDEEKKDNNAESSESTSAPVEAISANDTLTVLTGVNFRSAPSTDSDVLDVVPTGAEITYLGEMDHGFYKVEYKGKTGYVYSDYVSK